MMKHTTDGSACRACSPGKPERIYVPTNKRHVRTVVDQHSHVRPHDENGREWVIDTYDTETGRWSGTWYLIGDEPMDKRTAKREAAKMDAKKKI